MHIWIVLAAFALATVTPYLGVPPRSDTTQIVDELTDLDQGASESEDDS